MTTPCASRPVCGAAGGPARISDRVAQLRTVDGERRSLTPPPPRSAKIGLTSRCNYRCEFCAYRLRPGPEADMPWTVYTRIARELRSAGVEQLGLFYIGEPMLYAWLEEAVRYAKEACGYPYVFLTTNGSLATGARVEALMAAGLDSLKFALNFADDAQLARCAGVSGGVNALVRNVLDACDRRDALERRTGRRCRVSASSLRYDDEQPRRMAPVLDVLEPRLDEHYWLPLYGRRPESLGAPAVALKALPCWPLFTEAHVTADARLSACPLDHSPRFHVGALARCGFSEAWASPPMQALRAAHLAGDASGTACGQCIAYD